MQSELSVTPGLMCCETRGLQHYTSTSSSSSSAAAAAAAVLQGGQKTIFKQVNK